MLGPLLSVLLLGMVPLKGPVQTPPSARISIARPAGESVTHPLSALAQRMTASGAVIVDLDSAQTLFSRSADVERPMASLTKLMTALIIVENHDLGEPVTVPNDIAKTVGNVARLPAGETFSVGDLLSALLIPSGNDAAMALAQFHSGSAEAFVADMNARAKELGLANTSFKNPSGLDDKDQRSTPEDITWLAMFVMRRPEILERMGTRGMQIRSREGTQIYLTHTHALLHADTAVVAGKTGTTDGAGQCLYSIVETGGRRFGVVLMNSSNRYSDMRAVLDALAQPATAATDEPEPLS